MKKGDKVSKLKERKRIREKRQRWRKREKKRREKLISGFVVGDTPEEAQKKLEAYKRGEPVQIYHVPSVMPGKDVETESVLPELPPEKENELVWMPVWWIGLPKILRTVTWPVVWLHVRYLKWKYPPTYIKTEGDNDR